ncbi:MAG: glycosyltransferase family 4 protein [Actinomycetota bacterium]
MRILIVNYEYPPLGGGGGVLTQTLVRELATRHEVTVLTSKAPGLLPESYEDGARIVRVPVVRRTERERASMASLLSFAPAARRAGARILAAGEFDLVHTFFAVPSGPAGTALARRAGLPHVLTLVGGDVYDPTRAISPERFAPMRAMVRRVVAASTAVTAISTDLASRAVALTGRSDIEVVACAAPPLAFPPRRRQRNGACVFVTVARLVRRKALGAIVRSVPDGARLVVVGDGPERPTLERAAAPGRVEFVGALDDANKLQALADADAFVLASLHEAFGIVYLEAMQAGLPVIAGSIGGQTDFLTQDNAVLVPPGDALRIEEAMRALASDPARRRSMGESARATAAAYTPPAMADAYERVYDKALR